jgi:ribosome recycling factor
MNPSPLLKPTADKMTAALAHVQKEFSTLHTGKANPAQLEGLHFSPESYGGSSVALKDVAAITAPDARMIVVQPWDKSLLKEIEKAILTSNMGFNPRCDADVVRITIPELSKERRMELTKMAGKMSEEGRIVIRNIRRDANDMMRKSQKEGKITEDDLKRLEKELQALTDDSSKKIDELLAKKEKELMAI